MCINYRALNRVTIKNNYPLSRVDDLLDRLAGATHFSRIDLKSDYYQIKVANEDVHKMTIPHELMRCPLGFLFVSE
jgi:hypothetical protein